MSSVPPRRTRPFCNCTQDQLIALGANVTDDCRFCSEAEVLCRLAFHPRTNTGADGRFAEIEKVVEELKTEITTIKTDVAQLSSKQSSAPKSSGSDKATSELVAAQKKNILALEKKCEELKTELSKLTASTQLNDSRLDTLELSMKPLTIEDKKSLIADISSLSVDKMSTVVDIVRAYLPTESRDNSNENAEIEIPLDKLDTGTLRRLQKFVSENVDVSKKRSSSKEASSNSSTSSSSSSSAAPTAKRSRKSATPTPAATAAAAVMAPPPPASPSPAISPPSSSTSSSANVGGVVTAPPLSRTQQNDQQQQQQNREINVLVIVQDRPVEIQAFDSYTDLTEVENRIRTRSALVGGGLIHFDSLRAVKEGKVPAGNYRFVGGSAAHLALAGAGGGAGAPTLNSPAHHDPVTVKIEGAKSYAQNGSANSSGSSSSGGGGSAESGPSGASRNSRYGSGGPLPHDKGSNGTSSIISHRHPPQNSSNSGGYQGVPPTAPALQPTNNAQLNVYNNNTNSGGGGGGGRRPYQGQQQHNQGYPNYRYQAPNNNQGHPPSASRSSW